MDFWSVPYTSHTISTTPTTKALNNVTLPNLSALGTIKAAYAMFRIQRIKELGSSINYWPKTTSKYIQVQISAGGYNNAIEIPPAICYIEADEVLGDYNYEIIGAIDISSYVAWNTATNFRFEDANCNGNTMAMNGLSTGIRVIV